MPDPELNAWDHLDARAQRSPLLTEIEHHRRVMDFPATTHYDRAARYLPAIWITLGILAFFGAMVAVYLIVEPWSTR